MTVALNERLQRWPRYSIEVCDRPYAETDVRIVAQAGLTVMQSLLAWATEAGDDRLAIFLVRWGNEHQVPPADDNLDNPLLMRAFEISDGVINIDPNDKALPHAGQICAMPMPRRAQLWYLAAERQGIGRYADLVTWWQDDLPGYDE